MHRVIIAICLLTCLQGFTATIPVKNIDELNEANKKARPGDQVLLANGFWENVTIKLTCNGTKEKPIVFKAETAGKVIVTGQSRLQIGGEYIIVDGLYFTNGNAGDDPVISFRSGKDQLANHCRVTNTVIDNFNNPKRMDENYWVALYGKDNRLDHCSFTDKNNMGVLLAVILDDDRSRKNFHSIDHNYFGRRIPLASNGGEIIRVGVSQHCQFNSNTSIHNNFFDRCDGETEIVSIKSCANEVKDNVFRECQGSVVLRHGDNNIVSGNYFLGNNKTGTGGVRVINKGQTVTHNIFYRCRGLDFRSPMAIMNGIPNSPAHRYVQVTNAEIRSNTFYECSPITFGEGSDAERTLPPENVKFTDNTFYNTRDSVIYKRYDKIDGIRFVRNKVSSTIRQGLPLGFIKTKLAPQRPASSKASIPASNPSVDFIPAFEKNSFDNAGAAWFKKTATLKAVRPQVVNCASAEEVYAQLEGKDPLTIQLTGEQYNLEKPFYINRPVTFKTTAKGPLRFITGKLPAVFVIGGNGNLVLQDISVDGSQVKASYFVASSEEGHAAHYNLAIKNSRFMQFSKQQGCESLFFAHKSMVADSIVFRNNVFADNTTNSFLVNDEKDDKGYYNAERIIIDRNQFTNQKGVLVSVYRGGNDESTLGPHVSFTNNLLQDCASPEGKPLLSLFGVQVTYITGNEFHGCNPGKILVEYRDIVRARHLIEKNVIQGSGSIDKDPFVVEKDNTIQ